jgi:hypothetical protein
MRDGGCKNVMINKEGHTALIQIRAIGLVKGINDEEGHEIFKHTMDDACSVREGGLNTH